MSGAKWWAATAVKNYVRRATVESPRRLSTLMSADSNKALTAGLLLISVMPLGIIIMPTIGALLAQNPC